MNLEIAEINNKDTWEEFVLSCQDKTFLHSWNWGEFNKAMRDKIWRLGIYENTNLLAVALIIKVAAKRGSFLFCPQGPIINSKFKMQNEKLQCKIQNERILKTLIEYLRDLVNQEKVSFIRISPILEDDEENRRIFMELGFRPAPIHMHAETTWTLDIAPPEEKLLTDMRKTTRYLIKKAQNIPELKIIKSVREEDLLMFDDLYRSTAERHGFIPFSREYLKNQFQAFTEGNQISVFLANYSGKIISGAVIVYYGGSGFYHHGASSPETSKIPASYLLQWEAIKEAKRRNCALYNFWGIINKLKIKNEKLKIDSDASGNFKQHPWAGLTLFKTGFGGFQTDYLPAQDLPLKPNYWLTYAVEKIRKVKRHL